MKRQQFYRIDETEVIPIPKRIRAKVDDLIRQDMVEQMRRRADELETSTMQQEVSA